MKDTPAIGGSTPVRETAAPQPATPAPQPQPAAAAAAGTEAQAPSDSASVQARGSSATTVSLADGGTAAAAAPAAAAPAAPPLPEGPANGAFSYNDQTVSLFNQFAGNSQVHRGRIPVMGNAEARQFASQMLLAMATAAGQDPATVQQQLQGVDPVRYLQQLLSQRYPDVRQDGKLGPETLFYTIQITQNLITDAHTVAGLQAAQSMCQIFGGRVPRLDDMLRAKVLQFGLQQINQASTLDALQRVETQLQPLLQRSPELAGAITGKRGQIQEAQRQAEAARQAEEARRQAAEQAQHAQEEARQAAAQARQAREAQHAAQQQTREARRERVNERRAAIDTAMGPVMGSSTSDDMARNLVARGYNDVATSRQRATMIKEMLDGFTGDDDENAILRILNEDIQHNRINATLDALGPEKVRQLYDDIDGAECDRLMTTMFGRQNDCINEQNQANFARAVSTGRLEDVARGKRGPISDQAAAVILNELTRRGSGSDEAYRALTSQLGMRRMMEHGVNVSALVGRQGNDGQKAEFVVNMLRYADHAATPALRDRALNEAREAVHDMDDDQTVEVMKRLIGPSDAPRGLHSFAQLPEAFLNELKENLDSFWSNTWKTGDENRYRTLLSDAIATRRRSAFADDDGNVVPGTHPAASESSSSAAQAAHEAAQAASSATRPSSDDLIDPWADEDTPAPSSSSSSSSSSSAASTASAPPAAESTPAPAAAAPAAADSVPGAAAAQAAEAPRQRNH